MVLGKRVDGVVLLSSRINDPFISLLIKWNFPFVLIGSPQQENEEEQKLVNYVDNDNIQAAKAATIYLLELGHRRIAFIGGSNKLVVTRHRLAGFKQALLEKGLPFDQSCVSFVEFSKEAGYEAIEHCFGQAEPPTAILVTDDLIALGVLAALQEKGFKIPEDVAVISFNNFAMAELSSPSLSSVDISVFQLGYQSASRLFALIDDSNLEPEKIIVPTKLVIRQSSQ